MPNKQEWLLTDGEIRQEAIDSGLLDISEFTPVEQSEIDVYKSILEAQLAKDEARFEKERELIRKDERERIADKAKFTIHTSGGAVIIDRDDWARFMQALKETK